MKYKIIVKNITKMILRVDKNGVIKVSAPRGCHKSDIDTFVESNKEWINSRLSKIPDYKNDAKVPYFDKWFLLKVQKSIRSGFVEDGDLLIIKVKKDEDIKKILLRWYQKKSKDLIWSIIKQYREKISRNVESITIREMSTKWGSCNYSKRKITLSSMLFSKPQICFQYVLLHEMVHLIYPNHHKEFYAMLCDLMPEYKKIEKILQGD